MNSVVVWFPAFSIDINLNDFEPSTSLEWYISSLGSQKQFFVVVLVVIVVLVCLLVLHSTKQDHSYFLFILTYFEHLYHDSFH